MKTAIHTGTLAVLLAASATVSQPAQAAPFDQQFIDSMTPHHQMSSMMAQMAVQKARYPEVRSLARKMLSDQQKEIAYMQQLRGRLYGSSQVPMNRSMSHTMNGQKMSGMMKGADMMMSSGEMMGLPLRMKMDMAMLRNARGAQFDKMFLRMMIPHHSSAIVMSDEALNNTARPEIRRLAAKIMDAQAKEIGQMHSIFDRRFSDLKNIGG